MKIGIDVDDVTFEFVSTLVDFYNLRYGKNLKFEDIVSFRLWEVGIGKTKEEAIKIVYDFYGSEFYEEMPFVKDASESILKLCEENEGCFVSARYSVVRERTSRFLMEQFPKSQVFYSRSYIDSGKTKAEICLEKGIEVMIEDEISTAVGCYEAGIRTLLFDKPWNRNGKDRNDDGKACGKLERVYNWKEILEKLGVKE